MHFDEHGRFVRTDIWREGKYLDVWSVVHFLSGITVAFSILFFNFGIVPSFVIAFLLLVAYEMFEVIAKIEETRWNRILDVVVGMISFSPAYFLLPIVPYPYHIALPLLLFGLNVALATVGWMESRKALVFEKKMRAEYMLQKEKFGERKKKRKARRAARRKVIEE